MQKHSKPIRRSGSKKNRSGQARPSPTRPSRAKVAVESPQDGRGFLDLLLQRIGWEELNGLNQRKHAAGRPAKDLSRGQLLAALIFHYTVSWAGSLAEHLLWLLNIKMSESNLSERRQALPWVVFEELLRRVLRPIPPTGEAGCHRDWRLVAIDGVSFSLPNNPAVARQCAKKRNGKGLGAFAKLQCAVLLEVGMHNPLAACLGWLGESEWKLAQNLLSQLPPRCLLLADRLYGCGAFLLAAMAHLQKISGHFLVRVKQGLKIVREIQRLWDGSRIVEIRALDPKNHHRVIGTLQVREIKAQIQRPGFRPLALRFWTSLLDAQQDPACVLVQLYARRWEQELYFRELKEEIGINDLLQSQTPETAAQEVAAMIIGSSLVAHERAKLKPGESLSHRISFLKVQEMLEPLWLTLLVGGDLFTEAQKQQLAERFYNWAAQRMMPKKRTRSCPRVMRQPAQPWPRKRNQEGSTDPLTISVISD